MTAPAQFRKIAKKVDSENAVLCVNWEVHFESISCSQLVANRSHVVVVNTKYDNAIEAALPTRSATILPFYTRREVNHRGMCTCPSVQSTYSEPPTPDFEFCESSHKTLPRTASGYTALPLHFRDLFGTYAFPFHDSCAPKTYATGSFHRYSSVHLVLLSRMAYAAIRSDGNCKMECSRNVQRPLMTSPN